MDHLLFLVFRVEDAFLTGHCASRVGGIQRVHNNIFSCGQLVNRSIKYIRHETKSERFAPLCHKGTQFLPHTLIFHLMAYTFDILNLDYLIKQDLYLEISKRCDIRFQRYKDNKPEFGAITIFFCSHFIYCKNFIKIIKLPSVFIYKIWKMVQNIDCFYWANLFH